MKELKVVLDIDGIKMLAGVHLWLCQAGSVVQLETPLLIPFSHLFFSLLLLGYVYLFLCC